jgi:hypothetical protein
MSFVPDGPRKFVNSLPVVGGLMSSIWGDPGQEAHQKALQRAREEQLRQRAFDMDAQMNAMNQGAQAFGPRNQMLGQMMGQQGPAMDLQPMLQNPMSQAQQDSIRSAAFDGHRVADAAMNQRDRAYNAAHPPPPGAQQQPQGAFTGAGPQNPYRRT